MTAQNGHGFDVAEQRPPLVAFRAAHQKLPVADDRDCAAAAIGVAQGPELTAVLEETGSAPIRPLEAVRPQQVGHDGLNPKP